MKKLATYSLFMVLLFQCWQVSAQENSDNEEKLKLLEEKRESVISEEKEALKKEVLSINERIEKNEISIEEADKLKLEAANKHALNIENKTAIIDNSIALLERGEADDISEITGDQYKLVLFDFETDGSLIRLENNKKKKKFDKRTHSNLLVAFGFNNAIIDGLSLNESPYSIGRSRFFEMGWTWSTRVFNNSNAVRFRYGFSFSFNGLIPTDNRYFVQDGNLTYLDVFYAELKKAKLRTDHLTFPLMFEFGPSKKVESQNYVRYSGKKKFKYGIGGYFGFNLSTRQKLKYYENGAKYKEKIRKSYNTNNIIYGVTSYIGYSVFSLYVKYDLNDIFKEPSLKQNNISMGLRFDL